MLVKYLVVARREWLMKIRKNETEKKQNKKDNKDKKISASMWWGRGGSDWWI